MKISIGPIPEQWSRNDVMTFYDAVALSSADVVYIGGALCALRLGVQQRDRLAIARELAASGKEIVMSVRLGNRGTGSFSQWKWIEDGEFPIEADDDAALTLASKRGSFVVGPDVRCDGEHTLDRLVELGARRRVLPATCRGEAMKAFALARSGRCEIELPVLNSRQFSRWQCEVDPCAYDGLSAHSLSGCDRASGRKAGRPDWACETKTLRADGISVLRIVPRGLRAVDVAQILSELMRGEIGADEACARYADTLPQTLRAIAL